MSCILFYSIAFSSVYTGEVLLIILSPHIKSSAEDLVAEKKVELPNWLVKSNVSNLAFSHEPAVAWRSHAPIIA